MKKIVMALVALLLTGCANWALKEKCEHTNWFEYSQGVAFDGRYLEEDGLIKDCRKVDRINDVQIDQGFKLGREKMCQYDEIFSRAKDGVPVFFQFCDGLNPVHMKQRYADGLKIYCTADVGYNFGKSGRVYKNLCDAAQEKSFLPAYFKGRKEFLLASIADTEKRLAQLESEIFSLQQSESHLSNEISTLPPASECSYKTVYDESSKKDETKLICEEASYIRSEREEFYSELSGVRGHLYSLRSNWNDSTAELKNLKADLSRVP